MSNKNDFRNSLKQMSEVDLKSKIEEDELRIKKLKFAHAVSPLENPMSIRDVRKDLARLKTQLRTKQLGSKS
jgi:large subunit ribosomal protein L29